MADQGIWFKLWCSALDDPDLDNLDISDFGRWAKLGAYIKRHGSSGTLTFSPPCRALLSYLQCVTVEVLLECISHMPNVTVTCETNPTVTYKIEWQKWEKYQGDNSAHRVKKFRDKKRESVTAKKRREEKRIIDSAPNENSELPEADFVWSGKVLKITRQVHEKLMFVYDERLAMAEYPKADLWFQNNPQKRRKNIGQFMASWLEKASKSAPRGGGVANVGPNYF